MSRSPVGLHDPRIAAPGPRPVPTPRVEEKTGRTSLPATVAKLKTHYRSARESFSVPSHPPHLPRGTCAGPCEPSQRLVTWGPPRPDVSGRFSHAGFPQGFMTRRILLIFVSFSFWLTIPSTEFSKSRLTGLMSRRSIPGKGSHLGHRFRSDCLIHFHRRHRPVQGCSSATHPGRRSTFDIWS